jgi:hypothetical protein
MLHQTISPDGARDLPHHLDRSAAGIARSFADAGRDLPDGMADALAARIAKAGSWSAAYDAVARKVAFSDYTEEDRYLSQLVPAESDADHPLTALNSLLDALRLGPQHAPETYARRWARAVRLIARIHAIPQAEAEASLVAWKAAA